MIEIALLATTVVSKFLVPLFNKGKDDFTESLAEQAGRGAAESLVGTAQKIWARVLKRFDRDDEKSAAKLFSEDPEAMDKMLVKLLQKRLEEDQDFRQQINQLVEAPVPGTDSTSWQLIGTYVGAVDARNATISGGTVAGLIVGSHEPPGAPSAGDVGQS
jgi:hypothetical protein